MVFRLDFSSNTILVCFFYLYCLIPEVITQIFDPVSELVIHIGIPTKVAKGNVNASSNCRN